MPETEEWIASCLERFRRMLGKPRVRFRASSVAGNEVICQTEKGEVRLRFDQWRISGGGCRDILTQGQPG
jgi:hypothetical protein